MLSPLSLICSTNFIITQYSIFVNENTNEIFPKQKLKLKSIFCTLETPNLSKSKISKCGLFKCFLTLDFTIFTKTPFFQKCQKALCHKGLSYFLNLFVWGCISSTIKMVYPFGYTIFIFVNDGEKLSSSSA